MTAEKPKEAFLFPVSFVDSHFGVGKGTVDLAEKFLCVERLKLREKGSYAATFVVGQDILDKATAQAALMETLHSTNFASRLTGRMGADDILRDVDILTVDIVDKTS